MMQLSASNYQLTCNHCNWRSEVKTETSVSAHESSNSCPVCNHNHLVSQPVHMLDWLFEQAMKKESHQTENTQNMWVSAV